MAEPKQTTASQELKYASAGLKRETGWWGAFVIGLAGTILVTGIAPVMVTALGASSIPITVFITLSGWVLCLILAELAACLVKPDEYHLEQFVTAQDSHLRVLNNTQSSPQLDVHRYEMLRDPCRLLQLVVVQNQDTYVLP